MTNYKCMHRELLEQKLNDGQTPPEDKCYTCYGYVKTCPDYVDLPHLMEFVELFKADRQPQQKL